MLCITVVFRSARTPSNDLYVTQAKEKSLTLTDLLDLHVFFNFPLLENTSMELLLKGASMIGDREIKAHKFYSSGAVIKLENLGKPITVGIFKI